MTDLGFDTEEEYAPDVPAEAFNLTQFHEWYGKRAFCTKSMKSRW